VLTLLQSLDLRENVIGYEGSHAISPHLVALALLQNLTLCTVTRTLMVPPRLAAIMWRFRRCRFFDWGSMTRTTKAGST
jgi:hypothetical protein